MFDMRTFIRKALMNAVGKMPDYQIMLKSAEWMEKGVLTENDLADIQDSIDGQYPEATDMEQKPDGNE